MSYSPTNQDSVYLTQRNDSQRKAKLAFQPKIETAQTVTYTKVKIYSWLNLLLSTPKAGCIGLSFLRPFANCLLPKVTTVPFNQHCLAPRQGRCDFSFGEGKIYLSLHGKNKTKLESWTVKLATKMLVCWYSQSPWGGQLWAGAAGQAKDLW